MGNENEISQMESKSPTTLQLLKPICKPLRIEINRLEIPSNGVVIVKDGFSDKTLKLQTGIISKKEGEKTKGKSGEKDMTINARKSTSRAAASQAKKANTSSDDQTRKQVSRTMTITSRKSTSRVAALQAKKMEKALKDTKVDVKSDGKAEDPKGRTASQDTSVTPKKSPSRSSGQTTKVTDNKTDDKDKSKTDKSDCTKIRKIHKIKRVTCHGANKGKAKGVEIITVKDKFSNDRYLEEIFGERDDKGKSNKKLVRYSEKEANNRSTDRTGIESVDVEQLKGSGIKKVKGHKEKHDLDSNDEVEMSLKLLHAEDEQSSIRNIKTKAEKKGVKARDNKVLASPKNVKEDICTPNRISNRIKNRKIKFDVLRMLSGCEYEDTDSDSEEIPVSAKKPRKSKEPPKPKKKEPDPPKNLKELEASKLSDSPISMESNESPKDESRNARKSAEKEDLLSTGGLINKLKEQEKQSLESTSTPSKPIEPQNEITKVNESSSNDKDSEKENYSDVTILSRDKINVKLKEPPKKQVVNISLPSLNNKSKIQFKSNLHVGLGPDIVIKRVKKPNKENIGNQTKNNTSMFSNQKSLVSKYQSNTGEEVTREGSQKSEEIPSTKSIETVESEGPNKQKKTKLEKLIAKSDKPDSEVVVIFKQTAPDQNLSLNVTQAKKRKQKRVLFSSKKLDDDRNDCDENSWDARCEGVNYLRPQDLANNLSNFDRVNGKKTAKVTPLRQDSLNKNKSISLSLQDKEPDKELLPEVMPLTETTIPNNQNYQNTFEKFFMTENRLCEHNDSLDSDSSEDTEFLSHFIDLENDKKPKEDPLAESSPSTSNRRMGDDRDTVNQLKSTDDITIYDLMQEISLELPTWNIHVLPNSDNFCLVQLDNGPGNIPIMRKVIHFDGNYNAKVYINQTLMSELEGLYDSYESIKQLIYSIDQM